jgi:hypothetical protein
MERSFKEEVEQLKLGEGEIFRAEVVQNPNAWDLFLARLRGFIHGTSIH